eukprot:gene11112-13130_t
MLDYFLFTTPECKTIATEFVVAKQIRNVKVVADFGAEHSHVLDFVSARVHALTQNITGLEDSSPAINRRTSGWKMCDTRPFLGAVFQLLISPQLNGLPWGWQLLIGSGCVLKNYSHWAWADTDAYVGDLSKFITPGDLEQFDMITSLKMSEHQLYTMGLFTIFKNNDFGKNYWKLVGKEKLKLIVSKPENQLNDEVHASNAILTDSRATVKFLLGANTKPAPWEGKEVWARGACPPEHPYCSSALFFQPTL